MVKVMVNKKTNEVFLKTDGGDYHRLMLQGGRTEGLNEDDLVQTGQFSMQIDDQPTFDLRGFVV